jgi:hypothetical protein
MASPRIRVTRSARKHRIGNARILEAMVDAGEPVQIGDQLLYIGRDRRGVVLHIVAVRDDRNPDDLAVIHAMPASYVTGTDSS